MGYFLVGIVSQGSSFLREARFAGKLVSQGSLFRRETRFAGNSTKNFIFILVVKNITCNTKVGEIMLFCDLRNVNQWYS